MTRLEDALGRLETLLAQAESQIRSLSEENARLRVALVEGEPGAGGRQSVEARPMRLMLLEAERQDVRARLRTVVQAL